MRTSTRHLIKTGEYCLLSVTVLLLYTIFYKVSEGITDGTLFGQNVNLVSFVIMMSFVCAIIIIFLLITLRINRNNAINIHESEKPKTIEYILAGCMILCSLIFFYLIYRYENDIYPYNGGLINLRHQVSRPLYASLLCVLFLIFLSINREAKESKTIYRTFASVFFAILCASLAYAPNPFLDISGGMPHAHAYVNSIINVADLHPYDNYMVSIYGHYGLIYLPIVKLLGNNYTAVALSISLFTFITFFCVFEVCNYWIKKDSVFFVSLLAIMAIPLMIYRYGQFYQVNPHRLLFPGITLYAITCFIKYRRSKIHIWVLESVIGMLSVVWNLETGVFSLAVFCIFNYAELLCRKPKIKSCIYMLIKDIALVVFCCAGAYLFVCLYSQLTGAKQWLSVRQFAYPFIHNKNEGSSGYRIAELRTSFCTIYSTYVAQLVIFSITLLNTAHAIFSKECTFSYKQSRIVLLCIAISGLGSITYFVNRAAYHNLSITWIQMVLVLGIYGNEGLIEYNQIRKKTISMPFIERTAGKLVMLLFVFVFAIEGSLGFDTAMKARISTSWQTESFKETTERERQDLPDDILAVGRGVPELFFDMQRDDYPALIDFSDMNIPNTIKINEIIDECADLKKPILFGADTNYFVEYAVSKGYEEISGFAIGETIFKLMNLKE